jgi:hypothetical protein
MSSRGKSKNRGMKKWGKVCKKKEGIGKGTIVVKRKYMQWEQINAKRVHDE